MYEANILVNTTILFEKDGWVMLDSDESNNFLGNSEYISELWHKCIDHNELTTAFVCVCDIYTKNVWRCTNCQSIVPPEFVGLWKLHNFDKQSDQGDDGG